MIECPNCDKPNIHQWIDFKGDWKIVTTVCIHCGWRHEDRTFAPTTGERESKKKEAA